MGISEQSTLLCEQKLLTSRQIFRHAVPARTVTKKALLDSKTISGVGGLCLCLRATTKKSCQLFEEKSATSRAPEKILATPLTPGDLA